MLLKCGAAQEGARAEGDARGRAEPTSWKPLLSRLQQLLPKYLRNVYDRRALKVATWRRELMDERRAAAAASGRARPAPGRAWGAACAGAGAVAEACGYMQAVQGQCRRNVNELVAQEPTPKPRAMIKGIAT